MTNEQIDVLKDVIDTLTTVKDDKEERYKHVINSGGSDHILIVNRERHLESMIEWAIDVIGQNFDLEGEE
ncbi:hypothetical protein [Macrococcoides caseolyticum]|uniref:TscA family type II toxin-antitoxin system antitoxin n=1 Tax=Macrococcoides caseolyticum TaxID=69966 RepID=UPI000C32EE13|nr:hypothetical protein [Macrococcus caseolyticus]PKE49044.1 hypothetical protein CW677_01460 [Macrococcus caseolyticus]PKF16009.1 hypothetical protein CW690_01460 [Macrococcus caseolyticus]QYA36239.1 hypothetical protein KYI08_05050 [Macrococcus caseolyticus]